MNDNNQQRAETAWWEEMRIAAQLQEAVTALSEHYVSQPIQRDLVAHAENVSAWISMTCAYSLVEQALKAVLWKRGRVEAEQHGILGHDVAFLYDALPEEDKLTVEREFALIRQRYGGMPWHGVADFLTCVSRDFTSWRYLLIEEPSEDLYLTHPEAFLAIAKGLVECFVGSVAVSNVERPRISPQADQLDTYCEARAGESSQRIGTRKRKWRREKFRVHGLGMAQKRLKLHLGSNYELVNTINPDSQLSASTWIAITCGFSLLEQSIKSLLYRRNDPSAERSGTGGHQIDRLFANLPATDKSVIERGFATYASLFDEVTDPNAEKFLRRVGSAYNSWRYTLIERPRKQNIHIHPGALLEVCYLTIEILRNEVFTNHGMHDLGRRLCDRIRLAGVQTVLWETPYEHGLSPENLTRLKIWLRKAPNLLTGFATYLRGENPDSDLVADFLSRMEKQLSQIAAKPADLELRRYMERARQPTRSLIWDAERRLFV